jgi:hypothetical protein
MKNASSLCSVTVGVALFTLGAASTLVAQTLARLAAAC